MQEPDGVHHPREYENLLGARVLSGVSLPIFGAGIVLGCLASAPDRPEVRSGFLWGSAALGLGVAGVVRFRQWHGLPPEPDAAPAQGGESGSGG